MVLKRTEKECEGNCPECDSININWHDSEDFDSGKVYYAECDDCSCEFQEEYNLEYVCTVIEKEESK